MNKTINIILYLLSICFSVTGNAVVDSLKRQLLILDNDTQKLKVLNSLGEAYEEAGNDSAIIYYNHAHQLSEKIGEKRFKALTAKNIGIFYLQRPSFDTAMSHHLEALELYLELNDSSNIADQYSNIASSYYNTSQFEKALQFNLKAIDIYEAIGQNGNATILGSKLSELYMRLGKSDKALECLFNVIEYEPREEVVEHIASVYANIGYVYYQLGELDNCLDYFSKSLEFALTQDNKWDIALGYSFKGKVYIDLKRYPEAEENIMIAKEMFEELGDKTYTNKCNINLSELYNAQKKYDKAAHYAKQTIKVSRELGILWMENLAQHTLAVANYERGKYKEAYHAMKAHKCVNVQVWEEIKTKEIADIHVKYESEKKEQENVLLRMDNANQKKALFKQRIVRNVLLGLILVILFMGFFLLNRYLTKRKINKELVHKNNLITQQQKELSEALAQLQESNDELEQQKEEIHTQAEVLAEANATKDKFFSIIAHDLRTPFNSILGLCDLMLMNYDHSTDEKRKTFVQSIRDAATTTYNLLNNLLVWARSQSNRIKINKEELLITDLVENSIQPYMKNAEAKMLTIKNLVTNGKTVVADKYTMSTVLGNLFSNAVKFTNNGGNITLEAHRNNGHINIIVSDTGVGIAEKDMDKLFKITENFSTPGTQKESGTGLGLILCKEFVEKNGGKIEVSSKQGKGTTFTICIPAQ